MSAAKQPSPQRPSVLEPIARCPFCSAVYDEERVRSIDRQGGKEVFHATCLSCKRAMIFSLERKQESVSCVGMFTDCDADDYVRFSGAKRITLNDVLEMHVVLHR